MLSKLEVCLTEHKSKPSAAGLLDLVDGINISCRSRSKLNEYLKRHLGVLSDSDAIVPVCMLCADYNLGFQSTLQNLVKRRMQQFTIDELSQLALCEAVIDSQNEIKAALVDKELTGD